MGATMEQGTILAWRVSEGDSVSIGTILCELETDKSTFDFESPVSGTVLKLVAQPGTALAVGGTMAVIGKTGEQIPADWLITSPEPTSAPDLSAAISEQAQNHSLDSDRVKISPKARKLAKEIGIDISTIKGSGPDGRIESADIERARVAAPQIIPFTNIRKQINRKVTESKQQIPHFYLQSWVDMARADEYRAEHSQPAKKISYNALLAKAVVAGLTKEPALNVTFTPEGFKPNTAINVGLAIETPQGVIIGVIDNVDSKDAATISDEIAVMTAKARAGDLNGLKMAGACMTISNLGMHRVDTFIPIIHAGEAAILGIGSISKRPVAINDRIECRLNMPVTVCVDHRIADGAVAARFLDAFAKYLESL
jgi:pyruvate dehydrogenase E2 component (dihydrolipoamide acetyltransferase)